MYTDCVTPCCCINLSANPPVFVTALSSFSVARRTVAGNFESYYCVGCLTSCQSICKLVAQTHCLCMWLRISAHVYTHECHRGNHACTLRPQHRHCRSSTPAYRLCRGLKLCAVHRVQGTSCAMLLKRPRPKAPNIGVAKGAIR